MSINKNHWSSNTPVSLSSYDWDNPVKVRNLHTMNECWKYNINPTTISSCYQAEKLIEKKKKELEEKNKELEKKGKKEIDQD